MEFHESSDLYVKDSEWSLTRAQKQRKSPVGYSQKWSRSLTGAFHYKWQFKWVFAKVVVTRAGRLQEWSQGELRLYSKSFSVITTQFLLQDLVLWRTISNLLIDDVVLLLSHANT